MEESQKGLHAEHENARRLAEEAANLKGVSIDPEKVQTNIVIFDVSETGKTSPEICTALKEQEILASPFGNSIRMVTHYDVSHEDIEKTLDVLASILAWMQTFTIKNSVLKYIFYALFQSRRII